MKFNKEQSEAILDRGHDLLLSASAGTGKTAVLIERVCNLIIEDGAKIDEFLIVTFTEAAALELKSRISERLNRAIDDVKNTKVEASLIRHLSSQLGLLPLANISTIHGFCKRIIQENFTFLDIEPDFRVADNSEMNLFKDESFKKVLAESHDDEDILPAIWAYAKPQSDDNLKSVVMSIYSEAASSNNPELYFDKLLENTALDSDFLSDIQHYASEELKKIMGLFPAYTRWADASCFDKYLTCAEEDMDKISQLSESLKNSEEYSSSDYQRCYELCKDLTFASTPVLRGKKKDEADLDACEKFKALRKEIKDRILSLAKKYFNFSYKQLEMDIENSRQISLALIKFTVFFYKKYSETKRKHNLIDFDDMQHFALQILENEDICHSYKKSLKYIFVDEFQDTSDVQDALIEKLKTEGSLFIVGDYKQSIYAFRKARPELFLKKYEDFDKSEQGKTIALNQNFRSLAAILASVNDVFENLMTESFGGMDYQSKSMLVSGKKIVEPERIMEKTRLTFINNDFIREMAKEDSSLSTDEIYLKLLIKRIYEILEETYPVFDEAGNLVEERNFTYGDICILSRSPNQKAGWIKKIFEENGIPLSIDIEENLFEIPEILTLVDFLRLISNPKDDMALLSLMRSHIGSFTDDELFELSNIEHNYYSDFLDAKFREKVFRDNTLSTSTEIIHKLEKLENRLEDFRKADHLSIRHRLFDLIQESGYIYHCLGKRGGYSIYHAVEDFLLYIDNFESSGKYGLFQLLEHFDDIIKKGGVLVYESKMENESDSVKLLSIHKSKGLQFKYVIIQDIQKTFNKSHSDSIVLSDSPCLYSKNVYREAGISHKSPIFHIEKDKNLAKEVLEEMRLLYVAMTRAEYRLELFAKTKLSTYSINSFTANKENNLDANSYLEWILNSIGFKGFLSEDYENIKSNEVDINENWMYKVVDIEGDLQALGKKTSTKETLDIKKYLNDFMSIEYPSQRGVSRKTVSQLKASENKREMINLNAQAKNGGADRGNAYHKFMQFFIKSKLDLDDFLNLNEEKNYLSKSELSMIEIEDIKQFTSDNIYSRIKRAETVWVEKPFVYKIEIDGELYHLQGIIDLAFLEDDKIIIVDYKTDRLKNEQDFLERYHTQLELYSEALSRITELEVKESLIYSFEMGKIISY